MIVDYTISLAAEGEKGIGEMSSGWFAQARLDNHHLLQLSRHSQSKHFLTSLVKCNSEGKAKTSTADTDSGEHSVNMTKKPRSSTY